MTSDAPGGSGPTIFRQHILLIAVLAATAIVYAVTLQFGFVYDDLGQIVTNPAVQSWRYFPDYFRANVWMQQTPVGNYYRPVFLTWLLLNHTLFGLHPAWWHLTTVLAHLGATALVFLLALRLTSDRKIAAVSALLFGLHPVHLESVAWISGVTDVLLALFLIPAFLAYLNFREREHGGRWLAVSVGLYALALLTKETGVVLPALIAAYHLLCPEEKFGKRVARAAVGVLPFVAVTAVYLVLRAAALRGLAHTMVPLPGNIGWLTIPSVLWFYISLLVAPLRLSAFYDTPYITHVSWRYFVGPLLGVAAAAALVTIAWKKWRSPVAAFAAAWMVVPLLPVLRLSWLPMGDFVHDRYLYLPSIGFCLLVAMALARLDGKLLLRRPAGQVIALGLCAAMAVGTVAQSFPWADDLLLYQHGMRVAPNNDLPRNKFAATLVQRGLYEQGIRAYRFVLANDPDYWYANYRMGFAQFMTGHYAEAEGYLQKAVNLNPMPDEYYFLGLTRMKLQKHAEAETAFRRAVRLAPNVAPYEFALGVALKLQGRNDEALESFRAVLALAPNDAAALAEVSALSKSPVASSQSPAKKQ
jgi:tetratricopeptide (TPR) repeat protein